VIDEVVLSGAPEAMTLRGKAASMTGADSVKVQKTRHWKDLTINTLVSKIAKEHGLKPIISTDLQSIYIDDLSQTDESNIHLLTRISGDYDAVVKVTSQYLIFAEKGQSRAASGDPVPPVTVKRSQCKPGYNVTIAERDSFASVRAKYHNKSTAKIEYVDKIGRKRKRDPKKELDAQTSGKQPQKTLRHTYATQEQAARAAQAEMDRLTRGTAKLSLPLSIGMPAIAAEGYVTLTGFRDGINGDWNVTKVTHTWSNSGAVSSLTAESV
jgi:phage protein D